LLFDCVAKRTYFVNLYLFSGKQLQTYLKSEAGYSSQHCTPHYFSNSAKQSFEIVPIEVSLHTVEHVSFSDQSSVTRKDLVATAAAPLEGNASVESLFSGDKLPLAMDANSEQYESNPNLAFIVGPQGSGKTALVKKLLKQYSERTNFPSMYVFFFQCRHIDFDDEQNLLELLTPALSCPWITDQTISESVLIELSKTDKLLIIIDDLHYAVKHFSSAQPVTSYKQECNASSFIQSILNQTILPKAKLLVTTRPQSLIFDLKGQKCSIVNILGLSNKSLDIICDNIAGTDYASKIVEYICANPFLKSFCHVLENCFSVVHVVNEFLPKENQDLFFPFSLPVTRVIIAAHALLLRSKNLQLKDEVLPQLAELAWNQIKESKLMDLTSSLLKITKSLNENEPDTVYTFDAISTFLNKARLIDNINLIPECQFHFLWLEVLAAFHCAFNMNIPDFQKFLDDVLN